MLGRDGETFEDSSCDPPPDRQKLDLVESEEQKASRGTTDSMRVLIASALAGVVEPFLAERYATVVAVKSSDQLAVAFLTGLPGDFLATSQPLPLVRTFNLVAPVYAVQPR